MKTGKEESVGRTCLRSAAAGCFSVPVLFLILMIAAVLGGRLSEIFVYKALTSKICLGISSVICGALAARKEGSRRLAHAMAGECVLFLAVLLCGIVTGFHDARSSLPIDAAIVLFGGFAGTLLTLRPKIKRRGKR